MGETASRRPAPSVRRPTLTATSSTRAASSSPIPKEFRRSSDDPDTRERGAVEAPFFIQVAIAFATAVSGALSRPWVGVGRGGGRGRRGARDAGGESVEKGQIGRLSGETCGIGE